MSKAILDSPQVKATNSFQAEVNRSIEKHNKKGTMSIFGSRYNWVKHHELEKYPEWRQAIEYIIKERKKGDKDRQKKIDVLEALFIESQYQLDKIGYEF